MMDMLDMLQDFPAAEYDYLFTTWNSEMHLCAIGDQKLGLFYAQKLTAASHEWRHYNQQQQ